MIVKIEDAKAMDETSFKVLTMLTLNQLNDEQAHKMFLEMIELSSFFYGVLTKRIEICKLPIKIDERAWIYLLSFLERTGPAVLSLIDLLEHLEDRLDGEWITIDDIVAVYPYGFYNDKAATKRIKDIEDKKYSSEWCKIY